MAEPTVMDGDAFMRRFRAAMLEESGPTLDPKGPACAAAAAPVFELAQKLRGVAATPEQMREIDRLATEAGFVVGTLVQSLFHAYRLLAVHGIDLAEELA